MKHHPLLQSIMLTVTFLLGSIGLAYFDIPSPLIDLLMNSFAVVLIYFFTVIFDKTRLSVLKMTWTKKSAKGFLVSLMLTALPVVTSAVIARLVFHEKPFLIRGTVNATAIIFTLIMFFAEAFIKQGFPEELIFRAYILNRLKTRYSQLTSMIWSVLLFTAIHAIHLFKEGIWMGLLVMGYAFSFACLASLLTIIFDTSWAAVAVHGGIHWWTAVMLLFGVSESPATIAMQSTFLLMLSLYLFYQFKPNIVGG
ncbi:MULTISPECIES: type II CAAX prenyl endopeptidase Rce1 family protein [unclassified Streptococcus]|uniref:CPBP family glutamic-type intramembrane protease n=1 Tax=unclassified Streptococcus TaxID=2608887 RepID=UPI00359DA75C